MIDIDWKMLLLQAANFLVLLLLLRLLLFKPVKQMLQQRSDGIRDLLAHAARERDEAAEMRSDYEKRLAGASEEAGRITAQAAKAGETIRNRIRQRAEEDRDNLLARTREELAEERRTVAEQLREKTLALSVDLAARTLDDLLDEEERRRLTAEMIERVSHARE